MVDRKYEERCFEQLRVERGKCRRYLSWDDTTWFK
jgi:hypothetical protein